MTITYRTGDSRDSWSAFRIFQAAILDLGRQQGTMAVTGGDQPGVLEDLWEARQPLYAHLAATSEHFWLAEDDSRPAGEQIIGYARSILRDGVRELTEFFVLPEGQSAGVGGQLLQRAFPAEGARHRVIIATTDVRALARYLKSGVYARFPVANFSRPARPDLPEPGAGTLAGLEFIPMAAAPGLAETLNALDRRLLGHVRPEDHAWLQTQSQGFVYARQGEAVGYGYVAEDAGPFLLLAANDYPTVLAHAERTLAASVQGGPQTSLYLEVPLVNCQAVDYLLANGYRISPFLTVMMSNEPFGKFENYIFPSPPFFL